MSHNPTSITITNNAVPSVTATGGPLLFPPVFQMAAGYDSLIYDGVLVKFENLVNNIYFMPNNPGVTTLNFDDLKAVTTFATANAGVAPLDISLTTINFTQLLYAASITIVNTLVKCNFPALKYATVINYTNVPTAQTTMDFPELEYVGRFQSTGSAVTTFNFPKLKKIYTEGFAVQNSLATTLNFPELVSGAGNPSSINLSGNSLLTTLNCPKLVAAGQFNMANNAVLSTINLPLLVSCTGFIIPSGTMPALTSLSFPSLTTIQCSTAGQPFNIASTSAANLTTVSFPNLKSLGNIGSVTCTGAKLNQTTVDHILVKIAAMDGTGGTTTFSSRFISLNGGTNATPSATGLAAKATLVARGCTVINN